MALSDKKVNEFTDMMVRQLRRRYNDGLRAGSYVVSKTVLDMLDDDSKSLTQRVGEVKRYCRIGAKPIETPKPEDAEQAPETEV